MELLVACGLCGMDPATDTFALQVAISAAIATPWYFRIQVLGTVRAIGRRLRGLPDPISSCPVPESNDPPTAPPA